MVVFQTPEGERQEAHRHSHQLVLLVVVKAVLTQPIMPQRVVLAVAVALQTVLQVVQQETQEATLLLRVMQEVAIVHLLVRHILRVGVVDQVQQVKVLLAHQLLVMVGLERQVLLRVHQ